MMKFHGTISDTTPSSATTATGDVITGMENYHALTVYANLVGATGGTLDVYLQSSWDGGTTWNDICHFPQLAAGASAVKYAVGFAQGGANVPIVVGRGTTGTPAPAIAANVATGFTFGPVIRPVYVAGASTSAGAAVTIHIYGSRNTG